jgi:hypothetical protein
MVSQLNAWFGLAAWLVSPTINQLVGQLIG